MVRCCTSIQCAEAMLWASVPSDRLHRNDAFLNRRCMLLLARAVSFLTFCDCDLLKKIFVLQNRLPRMNREIVRAIMVEKSATLRPFLGRALRHILTIRTPSHIQRNCKALPPIRASIKRLVSHTIFVLRCQESELALRLRLQQPLGVLPVDPWCSARPLNCTEIACDWCGT